MTANSPYFRVPSSKWARVTEKLIREHPLKEDEIAEIVLETWRSIFNSAIGVHGFKIGQHIFPKPQIMGALLHELIPLEVAARYPGQWRGEKSAADKDIVYIPDSRFSIELKTSSHREQIFGNRSYAQEAVVDKKGKSGYYLAVNFDKFSGGKRPEIVLIRFGWVDHTDWVGQKAATGQQSRLRAEVYAGKLKTLYPKS